MGGCPLPRAAMRPRASLDCAKLRRVAGRKFESLDLTVFDVPPRKGGRQGGSSRGSTASLFALPPAGPDVVLQILDRAAEVARKLA